MKKTQHCLCIATVIFAGVISPNLGAADSDSADLHATAIGESVHRLLTDRDVEGFADELSLTNRVNRQRVTDSAQLVLKQMKRMGLAPSRIRLEVKEVQATATGTGENPENRGAGDMLPTSFGIRIVLQGEPVQEVPADKPLRGEYELALGGAFEFPDGWRTFEGIRWTRVPDGVADEQTEAELMLVSNIVERLGQPLRAVDDPALAALGNTLIRFLKQRDEAIYAEETLRSFDDGWNALLKKLKSAGVTPLPTKEEFEEGFNMFRGRLVDSARGVLGQADALGIDFSEADIALKHVTAEHPYMNGGFGAVDGITSGPIRLTFVVTSNEKSKSGHPVAGDYTLTAGRGQRGPVRWTIEDKIRWEQFPDGLLGEKGLADLAFENYVEENGVLPPGTTAPEISFIRLDDGTRVNLSDFQGKVVVLEWWASWCGPCQEPMAKLQTLVNDHPEWKDKVEVVALSIDDELEQAKAHIDRLGWTNTFNAWAGPGNWMSSPAKQFRVHGIPACYVIDADGKIVQAGDPRNVSLSTAVGSLLR